MAIRTSRSDSYIGGRTVLSPSRWGVRGGTMFYSIVHVTHDAQKAE
jgi:hypothetical protein